MITALLISGIFVFTAKGNTPVKATKSHKKAKTKKGW
jgi:ABC-2 type transport system permease protein